MIKLNDIHLGEEIKKRFLTLEISKAEFAKRLGIPQQHVNRIFERDTMETKRLIKICHALGFNFFQLYCDFPPAITAYLSAINFGDGDMNYNLGDSALVLDLEKTKAQLESAKTTEADLRSQIADLKDNVATLKQNLADKDELIAIYKSRKNN